ncbi:hypothetical protein DA803_02780 [[Mycoplasma] phocae]|uniref:Lipoprotein n=1 Tax=[Mycoplasma] phocae TaxID=142651 RepID=A0A2Z5IQ87_9BACT|nr:hypothetical protein [[Mycoplasma] phocae]AXE60993.1 hypothetical protein DA803_02780 [[Mycoplasma] phocae]
MKIKRNKWLAMLPLATFALPLIAASCTDNKAKSTESAPETRQILENPEYFNKNKELVKLALNNFIKPLKGENEEKYNEFVELIKNMNENSDVKKILNYYSSEYENLISSLNKSNLSKKLKSETEAVTSFGDMYKIKKEIKAFDDKIEELKKYLADNYSLKDYESQLKEADNQEKINKIKEDAKESITLQNIKVNDKKFIFNFKNRELIEGDEIQIILYIVNQKENKRLISIGKKVKITENMKTYTAPFRKLGTNKELKIHFLGAKVTSANGKKYYWVPGFDLEKYVSYAKNKENFKINEGDESLKYQIDL